MIKVEEVFSQAEISGFLQQGASMQDIQNAVNEASKETSGLGASYQKAQQFKTNDPRATASNSYVASGYHDNLIQWQLELDSILERIEHMLRGDKPTWKNGSIVWEKPQTEAEIILNSFGVAEVMRTLSNYVNRNTVLSNYSEDTINDKMYDLGNELADLIYLKYEVMGLNSLEKRKLYPILVRQIVDVVHSSYLRALHGGERESLREARSVSQTEAVAPAGVTVNTGMQRERGLLNPMRYVGGKYK